MTQRFHSVVAIAAMLICSGVARGQDAAAQAAAGHLPESTAVPPEAWNRIPKLDWTRIALTNELDLADQRRVTAGLGFLMTAPTGQTVGVSEWFGDAAGLTLSDPKSGVRSWSMFRPGAPRERVKMGIEVVPEDLCRRVHAMLVSVSAPPPRGRAEVLAPAEGPMPIGTWGYFVVSTVKAQATTGAGAVTVYEAQILGPDSHHRPDVFCFGINSRVDPTTLHGGAVLDHAGHVLGIQTSYYPESVHGNAIVCVAADIHSLIDAAKLPTLPPPPAPHATAALPPANPVPQPPAATPAPPTPSLPPTPPDPPAGPATPADDPAEKAVRVARMYEASEQYALARRKLQQVIDTYPHASAAAEARADLLQIQGK